MINNKPKRAGYFKILLCLRTSNTSLVSNIIAVSLSQSLSKALKNNVILSFPGTKASIAVTFRKPI